MGDNAARKAEQALIVAGRQGHAEFINGQYNLQDQVLNGKPVYKSAHAIPAGFGANSGKNIFLYYHAENDAWVMSQVVDSLDVVAYAPSHIKNTWYVNDGKGPFVPDPNVKLITAVNGQVLTNLGAWCCDFNGEVALRIGKGDEPGSEQPLTVFDWFMSISERYPDVKAYGVMSPSGSWDTVSYRQYFEECHVISKAMVNLGAQPGRGVCIMGYNAPQYNISAIGAILSGAISVSIPTNASAPQYKAILRECNTDILVVEDSQLLARVLDLGKDLPKLRAIIQYNGEISGVQIANVAVLSWRDALQMGRSIGEETNCGREVQRRRQALRANKCCSVVYTAGTTGQPKPCLISHDNITWTARTLGSSLGLRPAQEHFVSCLPLHLAYAQMFDMWLPISTASTVWFTGRTVPSDAIRAVRPTIFFGTPLLLEIMMQIGQDTSSVSGWAKKRGLQGSIRQQRGQGLTYSTKMAESMVFGKIKKALGLDRCRMTFCGEAALPPYIREYFLSINVPIYEIYGSAECFIETMSLPGDAMPASVGKPLTGTQLRLTHGVHEIIVFGRNVFMGYLNDPELTAEAIDERGWLHTGDIAEADRAGFIYTTGRTKELLVTAGGENIQVHIIEARIKDAIPLVHHCMVVGHKRKSLSCILTIRNKRDASGNPTNNLEEHGLAYVKELGTPLTTVSAVIEDRRGTIRPALQKLIDKVNEKATDPSYHIRKWEILPADFTEEGGEFTSTGKLKRHAVLKKYQLTIDRFYGGEVLDDYENKEWYHGPISRQDTEMLLKRDGGGESGWFLIRQSTKEKNTFVITLAFRDKLYHNQIFYRDGVYNTHKDQGNHQYETLQQLVEHHMEGPNGFQTVLTVPCKKYKGTYVAEATEEEEDA